MKNLFKIAICISCILLLSGCMMLYGVKKPKPLSETKILSCAKKSKVSAENVFELDTTFVTFLYTNDTSKFKNQIKNHLQPLQAVYYDKSGQLVSFQINCYAGGFPNIKWNRNEIFNVFPPKLQAPIDTILTLEKQIKYLHPFSGTVKFNVEEFDYVIVVYWNKFMGRQSRHLIKHVQNNSKLINEKKIKIIYVNNDNLFANRKYIKW